VRILVTGSRDWIHGEVIREVLTSYWGKWFEGHDEYLVIIHGACPSGADMIADDWARTHKAYGVLTDPYPADWNQYGRGAGPIRNQEMVHSGPDVVLAFIRNYSRGSTHCRDYAMLMLDVPVRTFRENAEGTYLGEDHD
jgi:hypothetical protein